MAHPMVEFAYQGIGIIRFIGEWVCTFLESQQIMNVREKFKGNFTREIIDTGTKVSMSVISLLILF